MRTVLIFLAFVTVGRSSECQPGPVRREDAEEKLQTLGRAANEAFQRGDYAQASGIFRQALCLSPNSAAIYHGLGLAEAAAGHFDESSKALEKAAGLSPHDFAILLARAQVEASAGNFELAIRALRDAERLVPADPTSGRTAVAQLHGQLGGALLQQRKLDQALAQLLRARQAGLDDPSIRLMLSTLENNLGAYGDAITEAASLDGIAAATVRQRAAASTIAGLAYKNQKRYHDAIPLFKRAIDLAPSETAYLALSESYDMTDQLGEAAKLLEQAEAALPGSQQIALALGRSLVKTGDNQRAAAFLSALTRQGRVDPEAWDLLAQAENAIGEFQKATDALQQVARRQPAYPMIHTMIAQSLLKWETPDYEQALQELDRAVEVAPADPDIYYLLGKVYFSQGKYAEAVEPLRRAIELSPTVSMTYYLLGQALQKLDRKDEAKEQFDKMRYLKGALP